MMSKYLAAVSGDSAVKYGSAALGTAIVTWGLWALWRRRHDNSRLPPGPSTVTNKQEGVEYEYAELAKEYGDIFSFRNGSRLTIVLASHSAIKEAFVKHGDIFACRPINTKNLIAVMGLKDDVFSPPYQTEGFNQNKSFIMGCLRSSGFGQTKGSEDRIVEQIDNLIEYLLKASADNSPVNLRDILPKATVNIIFNIMFSRNYDYDDPELMNNLDVIRGFMNVFNYSLILEKWPLWLTKIIHGKTVTIVKDATNSLRQVIRKEVDSHISTCDEDNPRDFVDNYLANRGFSDINRIVDNVLAMLPDAGDTLALLIEWIILYITSYPEVQQKMVSEIEAVTDGNRHVIWSDRSKLPYTEATIREVMRISSPIKLTAPHAVSKDIIFRGYKIPKSANIFGLLHLALRDPQNYSDPDEFRPERFIDNRGELIKTDAWIPFSMGRRKCPGEQTAQIESFLIIANLVQALRIQFPPGEKPSLEPCMDTFIRGPRTFSVLLTKRQ